MHRIMPALVLIVIFSAGVARGDDQAEGCSIQHDSNTTSRRLIPRTR